MTQRAALLVACGWLLSATALAAAAPSASLLFAAHLTDLQGKPTTLAKFRAKRTVVDVWLTGCAPCVAELPYFETLRKQHAGDASLSFVSVTIDDADSMAAVHQLVAKWQVKNPVLLDDKGELFTLLSQSMANEQPDAEGHITGGSAGVPQLLVIDDQQRIWRHLGGRIHGTESDYLAEKRAFIDHAVGVKAR